MKILNTENNETLKAELNMYLANPDYEVTVEFKKTDGSIRIMNCTTAFQIIEFYTEPKVFNDLNFDIITESPKQRKKNDDVQAVFDVDKKSWRSFRWDNIIGASVSLFTRK